MTAAIDIGVGSDAWANKIRKRAHQLSKAMDAGYLELAEILYKMYVTPIDNDPSKGALWTKWGYNSYKEYAREELGLGPRKAERLRQIWFHVEERLHGRLDPSLKKRLYAIGWSKLREIAPLMVESNVEKWLSLAEQASCKQLTSETKRFRARLDKAREKRLANEENPGSESLEGFEEEESLLEQIAVDDDSLRLKTKVFGFYPDQLANVEAALDRAEEMSNSDSPSNNLSLICMDFLATNDFGREGDPVNILRYLSRMEHSLGVKLVAVNTKKKEVVYGMRTLEEMADWDG